MTVALRTPVRPLARPLVSERPRRGRRGPGRAPTSLVLTVLAAVTVMTLDAGTGDDSPVEPARAAAGEVFGPLQTGLAAATRPVTDGVELLGDLPGLSDDNARLQRQVDGLRAELSTGEAERNRLEQYDALAAAGGRGDVQLVPAHVVALGPAQAFSRTVTIDVGTADGVEADMTVLESRGLVGRVLRVDQNTATVLLVVDAESVVGGRLGRSMELGFLRGSGSVGDDGRLELDLVDPSVAPADGDAVVTWGSRGGAPYVPGVPIGEVVDVQASAGDQSVTATVRPYVDMSSLDLVGVVVGTRDGRGQPRLDRVGPGGG